MAIETGALHGTRVLRARVREFVIPPIHDGLVIGKGAPIGGTAVRKAVQLLVATPFEHFEVADDVIGDVLIRTGIVRLVPKEAIIEFVLRRIKPLMGPDDILHLDLDAEILVEDKLP
jgi:hypothetical protein